MSRDELHITVVTGYGDGSHLNVAHETALVKAALLYADRVTLASPRVAMLASMAPVLAASDEERAAIVFELASRMSGREDAAARIASIERKKRPTVDERYLLRDLRRALQSSADDLAQRVEDMLNNAGVPELALAMQAGVLDVDGLGLNEDGSVEGMVGRLADLLRGVVGPGSTTFPLLDETTAGLLGAMATEGLAPQFDTAHFAQPALGTRWIGDMEAFPAADMSAVLELRDALRDPLARYRQAIIGVSEEFRFTPMDAEFQMAASTAYAKSVTPELLRLKELAREKSVASLLAHAIAAEPLEKAGVAAVGFIGAQASDMPTLLGLGVGVGLDVVTKVYQRHKDLSAQQRQNAYFYLFEAERLSRTRQKGR
jgi:hypothetical protein